MIDVSIIIPTYNRLWCLPRAIESCLHTNCKVEIIVVDDGSEDETWAWLTENHDLVKIRQCNQGQTYAVNNGVSIAKGKYIRFLDSDDFLERGIIDSQYQKAEETNSSLVYSRVDSYIEKTKEIIRYPEIEEWSDFLEVQLSNRYGSHFLGMLFKTDLVKKVPRRPDYAFREDRMFLLEYALLEPKISFVAGCGGYWVKHEEQMQSNYQGLKAQVTNWQHLNIFKKISKKLEVVSELTDTRKNAICTSLWPLAHLIAKDNLKEAITVVNWIYQLNPNFEIPEKGFLAVLYDKLGFKYAEKLLYIRRIIYRSYTTK